jgi:hypothetical protein
MMEQVVSEMPLVASVVWGTVEPEAWRELSVCGGIREREQAPGRVSALQARVPAPPLKWEYYPRLLTFAISC